MAHPNLKDDPFPEKWQRNDAVRGWFARRLEGQSLTEIQLLGARAALRSVPHLHRLLDLSKKHGNNPSGRLLLACLHCYPISAGAAVVLPAEIGRFRSAATAATHSATVGHSTTLANAGHSATVAAAAAASYSAAVAASAHSPLIGARFTDAAAAAAAAATAAAYSAAANYGVAPVARSPARSALVGARFAAAAFEQDCLILARGSLEHLAVAPLWPRLERPIKERYQSSFDPDHLPGGFPFELQHVPGRFLQRLRALPDDFAVWAEWYEGILHGAQNGRYLFGLPTERALRLNVDFALIDDALWQGEPAALHAEMRRLVEVARGDGGEVKKRLLSPRPLATGKRKKATPPKTPVGQAMIANAAPIALQTALLIPLIEQEIERVKAERPNSNDAIADRDARLKQLEKLKQDAIKLQKAPAELTEAKITEKQAIKKVNAFFKPFRDCWNNDGEAFVRAGIGSGIFLGALSIAQMLGMKLDPLITTTVLGAITAEKPLVNVLKSANGMFKFGGS